VLSRRRPVLRNAGAVACLGVLLGCSGGAVFVDAPAVTGESARACSRLIAAVPETVADQSRRKVERSAGFAAAWGDPPIVLRCGVGRPSGFDELATCQVANGVAWFIPEDQVTGEPTEVVMTSVDRRPRVEVRLPEELFPPAAAMVNLAPALKRTTVRTDACH
jgi:hypothetical protein